MSERNPGVPGAIADALRRLASEVPAERVDRIWIFPPLARGRTESGVVAAGCYTESDLQTLVTVAYRAEETGRGITFQSRFQEEGDAPRDRLPRVMEGVVQRSDEALGSPEGVKIEGDADLLKGLIESRARPRTDGRSDINTEQTST